MTNRYRFSIFAVLALIIFSATSCVNIDKSLGSGFASSDYDLKVSTAEFSLPVQMKMPDSLQTIYSSYLIFGAYKDALMGQVTAGTAFHIVPAKTANDFGDNPQPNYLKLYIAVSKKNMLFSRDTAIPQNIHIYRILKDIDSLHPFSNSYSMADVDPVQINENTVYMGGDSIVCNLSQEFASQLLGANKDERDSVAIFLKKFKGFYITADPLPGSLEGGRFNLVSPSDVYLALSYKHISAANKINKDSIVAYYSNSSTAYTNIFEHSSSKYATTLPTKDLYVEGLAGIKPYIDFAAVKSNLQDWAQQKGIDIKKMVIAKAEVVLPYEFPKDYTIMTQYPPKLFLAYRVMDTATNMRYYQPIPDINIEGSGGDINRANFEYRMNVTSYIQKILKGTYTDLNDLKTWVFPIMTVSNTYSGSTSYYIENTLYSKAILNGNLALRAPQLVITYSLLP